MRKRSKKNNSHILLLLFLPIIIILLIRIWSKLKKDASNDVFQKAPSTLTPTPIPTTTPTSTPTRKPLPTSTPTLTNTPIPTVNPIKTKLEEDLKNINSQISRLESEKQSIINEMNVDIKEFMADISDPNSPNYILNPYAKMRLVEQSQNIYLSQIATLKNRINELKEDKRWIEYQLLHY